MTDVPPPPESVALLIEVLGLDNTLRLIEKRGGTKLYVPTGVGSSWIKLRAELEAEFDGPMVKALIAGFGGEIKVTVPLARDWRIQIYAARDMTHADIALRAGAHVETVRRVLKRLKTGQTGQSAFAF